MAFEMDLIIQRIITTSFKCYLFCWLIKEYLIFKDVLDALSYVIIILAMC